MKITPLDIKQQRFKQIWRGLDPEEVRDFLHLVAEEVEAVVRESMFLEEELGKKTQQLQTYRERENTLKDTMLTAQQVTEDMKTSMKKEAELVLAEARMEADKIISQAHERVAALGTEINELKKERVQLESELRHILTMHLRLLEVANEAEAEAAQADDTVQFIRRDTGSGER